MDEAGIVVQWLTEEGRTLATAESCTGGLLGKLLTDVSGASKVYLGGVISYAYEVKQRLLGVDAMLLKEKGAVCAEVAEQMALGVRRELRSDFALATTGNAGPSADPNNPNVGEIYIALATEESVLCRKLFLRGNREENREEACRAALRLLLENRSD